jgi:tetratricopeptide (TPR) repeat protein
MPDVLFPEYISRPEESQIQAELERVRESRKSHAVLLYGPGGVGKTWMVRELAQAGRISGSAIWVDPIDVDDSEYWLLSNLERQVISQLDSAQDYFAPYLSYVNRLPTYIGPGFDHETVVSHLGRIKEVFAECYKSYVEDTGRTLVIVFDTVETIRGMYLLLTLTQWMKALPATLFILSGRPAEDQNDPIRRELEDPYQGIPVTPMSLGDFTESSAHTYLSASRTASGLTPDEIDKLVRLSRGHPLWLAFTIAYLTEKGVPEEAATVSLATIERNIPYKGPMTQRGESLHEDFKRRLMTPYRETTFWAEAVKRLAVVRQSISRHAWKSLMSDRPLPDDMADLDKAWTELLKTPWIRQRANGRSVTLHDAVAEELAERIIPLHDQTKAWRRDLWRRSAAIYRDMSQSLQAGAVQQAAELQGRLRDYIVSQPEINDSGPNPADTEVIAEVTALDVRRRELDQIQASWLYYELLRNGRLGCELFLQLFEDARDRHDVIFLDLLAFEMQRFLPSHVRPHAFGDVIGEAISEFQLRLTSDHPELHAEIGLSIGDYLIRSEQPEAAISLLAALPEDEQDHHLMHRLSILRGNACMRVPGRMKEGLDHFGRALAEATAITTSDRHKLIAKAHKELGFYHRNAGSWRNADEAYQQARDAISAVLSAPGTDDDREEMASIQTNWAYVKGLTGSYREGQNLVESAITVRHRLGKHLAEGNSWSVCGEVYRYERRFEKAWEAYGKAERIFQLERNWPWLGLIYQEQAICLFQASDDGVDITPGRDQIQDAKSLITKALAICRDQAVRNYPSALNRAGRIFSSEDPEAGFSFLSDGIERAKRLSDGWFWLANLTEYAELGYRAWAETGQPEFYARITEHAADIDEALSIYQFPDLKGRWLLLQGHLAIREALDSDDSQLGVAFDYYRTGFVLIAQEFVGSSGASAIPGEFKRFRDLFGRLPENVRTDWQVELRRAWSSEGGGSTLLLARLEELF